MINALGRVEDVKGTGDVRPAALPDVDRLALAGSGRRIGFLFNHDQIHQVAHSLPTALAMAEENSADQIIICTTNRRLRDEVLRIGGALIGTRVTLVELRRAKLTAAVNLILGPFVPARKLLIYRDNLDFFRSLDVLVVTEKTSLLLKTRYGLDRPKIIHTRHGAGDRAIGFDPASALFDHVLCSGPKIRDRLVREVGLDPRDISIVGYPKFDLCPKGRVRPKGFDPKKLTVLYNPHPSPHLSSWYRDGRAVLDFFLAHPQYQLIFAPHVMLFERKLVLSIDKLRFSRPGRIARKYRNAPNIHIDTHSRALSDMSYTMAADIYLGDVSSQIYEFLLRPRPCLFLNTQKADWQNDPNYLHWRTGPVIDGPEQLAAGLAEAVATHDARYRAVQEQIFSESIALTTGTSSQRAARAITAFLDREAALSAPVTQTAPEAPLITLVLPYYNEAGWIGTTLQSLAWQSDRRFRLVLIDNASTDASRAEAEAACAPMTDIGVKHIRAEKPGKINALMAGTADLDTPFVATIDADTIYPKDYVARILRLFAANPMASAVMAIDLDAPMDSRQSRRRVRRIMRKARLFPRKCHAGGYAQAYRSDALEQAGGFTPAIWPYTLEDHEITARVFRIGPPVYAADHVCFPSDRRSDRRAVDWTWSERLLYKVSPAFLTVAFFHVFLAWRLRTRHAFSAELRQKSWL